MKLRPFVLAAALLGGIGISAQAMPLASPTPLAEPAAVELAKWKGGKGGGWKGGGHKWKGGHPGRHYGWQRGRHKGWYKQARRRGFYRF